MQKRNTGVEALRLFSMFLIVILHLCGKGGCLEAAKPFSGQYLAGWGFEMLAICSVNCYCLISGFVSHEGGLKIGRLLELWLEVIFYTLGITLLFGAAGDVALTRRDFMNAILPVTTTQYWYVSAYFGMFFLMPVLTAGMAKLSVAQVKKCLTGVVLLYTILPVALNQDPFKAEAGYSVIWLVILFLIGAYVKKSDLANKVSRKKAAGFVLLNLLISWGGRMLVEYGTFKVFGEIKYGYVLASYTSPFILLASVGFLVWFSDRTGNTDNGNDSKAGKLVRLLSKATLGVYLIHTHPLVFDRYMDGLTTSWAKNSVLLMSGKILGAAVVIFAGCLVIDLLRIGLFQLLSVKKLCDFVQKKVIGQIEK